MEALELGNVRASASQYLPILPASSPTIFYPETSVSTTLSNSWFCTDALYVIPPPLIHQILFFFSSFCFSRLHPPHVEVPRLGVESELQLPAYTRATATQDPSRVCNLHHSSQQRWIHNPLSKPRDGTRNLMVPGRTHFCCTTTGTPPRQILFMLLQSRGHSPTAVVISMLSPAAGSLKVLGEWSVINNGRWSMAGPKWMTVTEKCWRNVDSCWKSLQRDLDLLNTFLPRHTRELQKLHPSLQHPPT